MDQRILYQVEGQPVSIMIPCECELTVLEIGQKDVPEGLSFWIVDANELPEDRTFRNAWDLDKEAMGQASGIGGSYRPKIDDMSEEQQ